MAPRSASSFLSSAGRSCVRLAPVTPRIPLLKHRLVCLLIVAVGIGALLYTTALHSNVDILPLRKDHPTSGPSFPEAYVYDAHPISDLIRNANTQWEQYENDRSTTLRETAAKYRRRYGRHPPPGFVEWYRFARKRGVHNIDDFQQIMDDLRPFWATEPWLIRQMAASLSDHGEGMGGIHVRDGKVKLSHPSWRTEALARLISRIVKYLPDMDIAVNVMDQPRIIVPFEDKLRLLEAEEKSRQMDPSAEDRFTKKMPNLLNLAQPQDDWDEQTDPQWFGPPDHHLMETAKWACPPESPARDTNMTVEDADALYKTQRGGFVSNFNLSSDLCTVGPAIQEQHGLLFSPSSLLVSQKLVPVFGESKVNVNNDILFPANMYTIPDPRYVYNPKFDYTWANKADRLLWRGASSGGIAVEDNWDRLHRQRFVLLTNGSLDHAGEFSILSETDTAQQTYLATEQFNASAFAQEHFDVAFTDTFACVPGDCPFYTGVWDVKPHISLSEQFKSKYLIDIDGHSFSGRWRAFHFSKSLGLKATIFREWHDSRLLAWRHFVPLDNRYHDLYSLMNYFIGSGQLPRNDSLQAQEDNEETQPYIRNHDFEAEMIASQSRSWANTVLRDEDIEIYMLRLLLEYARVLDDNRDGIGYAGDGSELDEFDEKH